MRDVVIVSAVRTAIGKLGGALTDVPAVELGRLVAVEAIRRAAIAPDQVDEVLIGHALQAGAGSNLARQVLLQAGIPHAVPATTVNKVCASGMKAITLAALSIAAGENDVVLAGGVENMSAAPYLLRNARWGYRLGAAEISDVILSDALTDPLSGRHMGETAEIIAEEFNITRLAQDAFAAQSQQKAGRALLEGRFESEIVGVPIRQKKSHETKLFMVDEFPRPNTTQETLAALRPAFKEDGTVTAGNSSGINDGAAAVVLMAADVAALRGTMPMARILSYASAGVEPLRMGIGPIPATQLALRRAGISIHQIDLVELNEAFAAQSIAVIGQLDLDPDIVNVNGGAIALGHPVGATGARIVVTLVHSLAHREDHIGLATLCVGGGQGMAIVLER
ncbi:acetyl-CoA C-acetyltransferase [Candidatus Bipolaricaulota bacterium]